MGRMVYFEADGPKEIKPQEKSAWVCACGLSQNLPMCDGAHKAARQEDAGKCYIYDKERKSIVETKDD
jgi:CDGSH-type Zn-finger protein